MDRTLALIGAVQVISVLALPPCIARAGDDRGGEGPLTLATALERALAQGAIVREAREIERAETAARRQAGVLPNPTLEGETEDLAGRNNFIRASQPQTTVRLSQTVLVGGDRAARERAAVAGQESARWRVAARTLDVHRLVAERFAEVQGAQGALALAEDSVRLAERMAATVRERVGAGFASPVDETRADVAAAEVRAERVSAQQRFDAARFALAGTWGATRPLFDTVDADHALGPEPPPLTVLIERRGSNPDLQRWQTEVARQGALVDVQRAEAIPDVTLSAGYRRFHDTHHDALVVGVSVPLPLFDRRSGAIAEAAAREEATREEARALDAEILAQLATAYGDLSAAYNDVRVADGAVIPGAQRAYEAAHEGYAGGKFGLLDVLDAQRTLFAARVRRVRRLVDVRRARAQVERLVGGPLDAVPTEEDR